MDELGLYSKSAVASYMQIYRLCCGRPELVEAIKTTHLQIICARKFPEDLREEIFDRGDMNGTVEQLKDIAEKVRAGELNVKSNKVQFLLRDILWIGGGWITITIGRTACRTG